MINYILIAILIYLLHQWDYLLKIKSEFCIATKKPYKDNWIALRFIIAGVIGYLLYNVLE